LITKFRKMVILMIHSSCSLDCVHYFCGCNAFLKNFILFDLVRDEEASNCLCRIYVYIFWVDEFNDNNKSGTYQISCDTRGCNLKYIDQSRRAIQTQFVDHLRSFKNNQPENSAVAQQLVKFIKLWFIQGPDKS
jgi:hypothetical protein